ncbi:MAG: hypothetical protein LPK14_14375 [Hymenobacteraceae bacterium]|nr:hypothetical protein [Hymenobacteraceae bacterium]
MLRTIAVILLLFNGASALYGGGALILEPDGSLLQIPVQWLYDSPFDTYLIPGLVLFFVLGIGSLTVASLWIFKNPLYPLLTIVLGLAQVIWLLVQLAVIRQFSFLHLLYGALGIALVVFAALMRGRLK